MIQLPDYCSHCGQTAIGIRLWHYIGFGDWVCIYCGELWSKQFPKREYQDEFMDGIKEELIEQVRNMRPEPGNTHVRWFDKPRKTPEERKISNKEAQRKWRANNPDKCRKYSQQVNKQLKGQGTHNRVTGK